MHKPDMKFKRTKSNRYVLNDQSSPMVNSINKRSSVKNRCQFFSTEPIIRRVHTLCCKHKQSKLAWLMYSTSYCYLCIAHKRWVVTFIPEFLCLDTTCGGLAMKICTIHKRYGLYGCSYHCVQKTMIGNKTYRCAARSLFRFIRALIVDWSASPKLLSKRLHKIECG